MSIIFGSDSLCLQTGELEVWSASKRWAEKREEDRIGLIDVKAHKIPTKELLGDLVYKIRFPLFDSTVFADCRCIDMMDLEEAVAVFQYINGMKDTKTPFSNTPRVAPRREVEPEQLSPPRDQVISNPSNEVENEKTENSVQSSGSASISSKSSNNRPGTSAALAPRLE